MIRTASAVILASCIAVVLVSGHAAAQNSVMVEKNLFSPDRKPPVATEVSAPDPANDANITVQLDAVIIQDGEKLALLSYISDRRGMNRQAGVVRKWVGLNDRLETGHTVSFIDPWSIGLTRGKDKIELMLHGEKPLLPPVQSMPKPPANVPQASKQGAQQAKP